MGFLHRKFLGLQETPLEDVRRNLGHLLHAKRGSAWVLPGFGLTETGFRSNAERLSQLSEEIRETILRYESRVEGVEITEEPSDEDGRTQLVLHLRLKAWASGPGRGESLSLVLDPVARTVREQPRSPAEEG